MGFMSWISDPQSYHRMIIPLYVPKEKVLIDLWNNAPYDTYSLSITQSDPIYCDALEALAQNDNIEVFYGKTINVDFSNYPTIDLIDYFKRVDSTEFEDFARWHYGFIDIHKMNVTPTEQDEPTKLINGMFDILLSHMEKMFEVVDDLPEKTFNKMDEMYDKWYNFFND